MRFLDTNVILRYLTRDDEAKAEARYQLFQRVRQGEEELFTCEAMGIGISSALLRVILLLAAVAGLLLSAACQVSPTSVPPTTPVLSETPDIEATVEVRVQQELAKIRTQTPTLVPPPNAAANISAVEATERLRIYFEEIADRHEVSARWNEDIDSGIYNPIPAGCNPVAILAPPDYHEKCTALLKAQIKAIGVSSLKETRRARDCPSYSNDLCTNMTAEYHGQGTWLITVRGTIPVAPGEFEEQWWFFESGDIPPRKRTD